jgi:hypothetical protein
MLRRDNVFVGLGVGLFFFFTFLFVLNQMNNALVGREVEIFGIQFYGFTERLITILSVISNLLPFIVYMKAKKDDSMRGVGIVTILLSIGVAWHYFL